MKTIMLFTTLAAGALLAASTAAFPHGDEHPGKKTERVSGAPEQKPFGQEGDPRAVTRTISIRMSDTLRYEPAEIRVKRGETIRIVAANEGKTLHEIVIGTPTELKGHAELMRRNPGMEHDEPYMAHVKPGGNESIVWKFNRAGEFQFGCLVPGHFEAGMSGRIVVTP